MIVTLLDGRQISSSDVLFDPEDYHFRSANTGEDITDNLSQATKLAIVPDFDRNRDLIRVSNERGAGAKDGKKWNENTPTTTGGVLMDQVEKDGVLAAPLDSLNNAVAQVAKSSGVQTILVLGLLALGALVYFTRK